MADWRLRGARPPGRPGTDPTKYPVGKTGASMNSLIGFLPFVLILAGFIYFQGRRQRRAMQATIDLHESLRPGDRVHTTSGMEATVVAINDGTVELEEDDEAEDLAESDEPEESADSADQNRAVKGDT